MPADRSEDAATGEDEGHADDPEVAALRAAILDIDAHAMPIGKDLDGFVAVGYVVPVGAMHRALGVLGHGAPPCRYCALLQAEGKPGCDELRYEVGVAWMRDALVSIATTLGIAIEADYGAKSDAILLDDILGHIGSYAVGAGNKEPADG